HIRYTGLAFGFFSQINLKAKRQTGQPFSDCPACLFSCPILQRARALHIGSFLFANWEVFSKAAQPSTGRLGWVVRIDSRAGSFSLTKALHKPGKLNFVQFHVAQDKSKIQQNI
ncbi:MAG TPA: hypothetical protein H9999_01530, partial [Candidatus Negativibacillus faecipullorum]|nr:hypothetical protein [Candidatus Negativibacillus faecipullorum]